MYVFSPIRSHASPRHEFRNPTPRTVSDAVIGRFNFVIVAMVAWRCMCGIKGLAEAGVAFETANIHATNCLAFRKNPCFTWAVWH
jgi:hypothetical protein